MYDMVVIEQQYAPRLTQREALAMRAVGGKDARFSAFDILSGKQKNRHQIDTIAVRPLGRGSTHAAYATVRQDAELVHFDKPSVCTIQSIRDLPQPAQQLLASGIV